MLNKEKIDGKSWIVCQLGARENYAIARALGRRHRLAGLITDAWAPPSSLTSHFLPRRLKERWHPDLRHELVLAPTTVAALRQVRDRVLGRSGWHQIIARNLWFQREAARRLREFSGQGHNVFSYSYAAGSIFEEARRRGWRTVLGQIDPGPVEAQLVAQTYERAGQSHVHEAIPEAYWTLWRKEIDLADRVVVNSDWSRQALIAEGVPADRIAIIPLAYEREFLHPVRHLPTVFTPDRPLRLLFLGQVTLRKGIGVLFEALRLLSDVPFRLDIVGPIQVEVPDWVRRDPHIHLHEAVPRAQTETFYHQADLFLFPTLSDGFGLTQLEALAAGVPVIASQCCGEVVQDGLNGRILPTSEPADLARLIRELAGDPEQLSHLQKNAYVDERFRLETIGQHYEDLLP